MTPPTAPEYAEVRAKYPSCRYGPSYSCMYCDKCPFGEYFQWAEEDLPGVKAQNELLKQYHKEHGNGSILDVSFKVEGTPTPATTITTT